jgi:5'-hydroxyaverantin dehydrogenase
LSFSPNHTLDIVLACAGLGGNGIDVWLEQSLQNPDADPSPPSTAVLDVNFKGVFYSTHLALHYFKKSAKSDDISSKQLIVVSSLAGYVPLDQATNYNGSKFGVRGLWKAIQHSTTILGKDGPKFRTNLVAPTFIRTNMTAAMEPTLLSIGIELGEVEDVSAGVMRLACDETISGRAIVIAAREKVAGDRNFDLQDDWEGLDGGREVLGKIMDGTLRSLELVGGGDRVDGGKLEGQSDGLFAQILKH